MRIHRLFVLWLLPLLIASLSAPDGFAGVIFGRKNNKKPTAAERVPELLAQMKTDGDAGKRAAAAQELRQFDIQQFPNIVPGLIDTLLSDKEPSVRAEAARTLGKIRPISEQGGMALEQALAKDSSTRVRLQARSSLMQYHWSGYHSVRKDDLVPQTKEPPLADDKTPPAIGIRTPPRQPDNARTMSGYRAPNPQPYTPYQPKVSEPPLAPPVAPPSNPTPPARGGNENGPELTPP